MENIENLNQPEDTENKSETIQPEEKIKSEKKPKKKKFVLKLTIYLIVFFVTGLLVFSSQVLVSEQGSSTWFMRLPLIKQIKKLAESADRTLKGENEDRVNILLLGMGGSKHDGGYLTDTIMLASLEPSTKKVVLVSIPRDLAVPIENMGWKKINSVNAYAERDKEGSGGLATSQAISDILNTPIDYYVRIDFDGFVNIVDELGGLTIDVKNVLNDYSYPIMGREDAEPYESRFEHLYIEKGQQEMNGELALKYARSRHAAGIEGSDFSRAKRQQLIIEAVKEKALSAEMLLKPNKILSILNEMNEHISTNLKVWEIARLWELSKEIQKENITSKVLDNSPGGLLMDDRGEEGAYILRPRSGDFSEIQYFINNIFSDAPVEIKTKVTQENAKIEIYNGTWINGLASQKAQDIEKYGFTIMRIGNSSKQNFQKSVIYDLTFGEKKESLEILKEKTNADVSLGLPDWLIADIGTKLENEKNPTQPDFILVIGQEADSTNSGKTNPIE